MTDLGAKQFVWQRYTKSTYHAAAVDGKAICGIDWRGYTDLSDRKSVAADTYNPLSASRKRAYPRKPCKRCLHILAMEAKRDGDASDSV